MDLQKTAFDLEQRIRPTITSGYWAMEQEPSGSKCQDQIFAQSNRGALDMIQVMDRGTRKRISTRSIPLQHPNWKRRDGVLLSLDQPNILRVLRWTSEM
jgi:hypothetical protein